MDSTKVDLAARAMTTSMLELSEAEAIAALSWAGVMLLTYHSKSIAELHEKVSTLPATMGAFLKANVEAFARAKAELEAQENSGVKE